MNAEIQAAVNAAFQFLPAKMDSFEARIELYAIGFQESNFEVRRQYNNGPAASFWQFEKGGGIAGVLRHEASKALAISLCKDRNVEPTTQGVWNAMLKDDVIGAGFARLLLYTDPRPLPKVPELISSVTPEQSASWKYYQRNWRPGQPHPKKWPLSYMKALAVEGN